MDINLQKEVEKLADDYGIDKKRSIGEVAKELNVETHVIRFWEENFDQIKPEIGRGGRRYYYNKQLKVLKRIKKFLHEDGYTIAGLQKLLKKRKTNQVSYKEEDLQIINEGADLAHENDIKKSLSSGNFSSSVISNLSAQNKKSQEVLAQEKVQNSNYTTFFDESQEKSDNLVQNQEFVDEKTGEFSISDFINPGLDLSQQEVYNEAYQDFAKKKPRDEILSLMRNISKNLGDLKILLRS